jgi:hypothetical protein
MNPAIFFDYEGRVLSLLGPVQEVDFTALSDHLLRLDTAARKPISIYLSAQCGHLMDALKVLDVLATLRSPTTGIALGLNEGASVVILSACQKRIMLPSALLETGNLWKLPREDKMIGLHTVTPDSLHAHVHRRLKELAARWPRLVELVRAAENGPAFLCPVDALKREIIDEIFDQTETKVPVHHVR